MAPAVVETIVIALLIALCVVSLADIAEYRPSDQKFPEVHSIRLLDINIKFVCGKFKLRLCQTEVQTEVVSANIRKKFQNSL